MTRSRKAPSRSGISGAVAGGTAVWKEQARLLAVTLLYHELYHDPD